MISSTIHAAVTARTASHLKIRNAENSIANGASVMATSMLVRKSSLGEWANARRPRREPDDRKDDRIETEPSGSHCVMFLRRKSPHAPKVLLREMLPRQHMRNDFIYAQ